MRIMSWMSKNKQSKDIVDSSTMSEVKLDGQSEMSSDATQVL